MRVSFLITEGGKTAQGVGGSQTLSFTNDSEALLIAEFYSSLLLSYPRALPRTVQTLGGFVNMGF